MRYVILQGSGFKLKETAVLKCLKVIVKKVIAIMLQFYSVENIVLFSQQWIVFLLAFKTFCVLTLCISFQ